eukprot:jgi/Picsp_1/636/NSC_00632-R1_molybdenum cofactor sulfurase
MASLGSMKSRNNVYFNRVDKLTRRPMVLARASNDVHIPHRELFERVYDEEIAPRFGGGEEHYMDHTGSGIYLNSQVERQKEILLSGVMGNPHSKSTSSQMATEKVESMRRKIMEFFNASPEEYQVVFSRSATGALQMLGESFPWSEGGSFAYLVSNHNSVLGIRSYAESKGAKIGAFTEEEFEEWIENPADEKWKNTVFDTNRNNGSSDSKKTYSLLAYPKKDNFNGVLYPSRWIREAHKKSTEQHQWMVLLDAAAYVPTYKLDLQDIKPDFVCVSFYKVFGLPTGVGAWIMKKDSAEKLQRVFWGGSSVFTATSTLPWQVRFEDEAKWEDGTLPFLDIAALEPGFEAMERLGGIETVQEYVSALGAYMSLKLRALQHSNGKPLLRLFGKHYEDDMENRGNGSEERQSSIANFHILKPTGELFRYRTASRVFSAAKFHVRDGCMCNPGSCYMASGVRDEEIRDLALSVGDYKNWEYINVERNGSQQTLPMGSIRVSLGWMSRKDDIDALVNFLETTYRDKDADPVLEPLVEQKGSLGLRC